MTTIRICFNGDSLVNGTNDPDFQGWPGRLAQTEVAAGHDVSVYNLGIRGDTSVMISERWERECKVRLPDVQPCALVFSFGVNDIAFENGTRRVEFEQSLATAKRMISTAKAWLPTLWIGPPPVELDETTFRPTPDIAYVFAKQDIQHLSDAYKGLANDLEVPYFDLYSALAGDPNWLQSFDGTDAVHPKDNGYRLISDKVRQWDAWRSWFDQ